MEVKNALAGLQYFSVIYNCKNVFGVVSSATKLDGKATFDLQVSSNFAPSHSLLYCLFFHCKTSFNSLTTNQEGYSKKLLTVILRSELQQ